MNTACSRKGENKIVMQWENSLLLPGCTGYAEKRWIGWCILRNSRG